MRKAATSPGIAGNDLNRCDALALQHKIRAKSKRIAVFFVDSRLRGVEMGGGGWERVALGGNKKVCAKERLLVCKNWKFSRTAKKGTCKRSFCA